MSIHRTTREYISSMCHKCLEARKTCFALSRYQALCSIYIYGRFPCHVSKWWIYSWRNLNLPIQTPKVWISFFLAWTQACCQCPWKMDCLQPCLTFQHQIFPVERERKKKLNKSHVVKTHSSQGRFRSKIDWQKRRKQQQEKKDAQMISTPKKQKTLRCYVYVIGDQYLSHFKNISFPLA